MLKLYQIKIENTILIAAESEEDAEEVLFESDKAYLINITDIKQISSEKELYETWDKDCIPFGSDDPISSYFSE
jgi:hypothetical protein